MKSFQRTEERPNRLARSRALADSMPLVWGGGEHISVSTAPFGEVLICTNTLKRSLFNAQENAQMDWRVRELWQILCCWYLEGGAHLSEHGTVLGDVYMY
jgi:hypothetical protein